MMKNLSVCGWGLLLATGCIVGPDNLVGEECQVDGDCKNGFQCVRITNPDAALCLPPGSDVDKTWSGTGTGTGSALPDGGGGAGPVDPGSGPFYCDEIKPILDTYCASCHGASPAGGAPATFRLDVFETMGGVPGAGAKAARVKARASDSKTMPPPSSPQPTSEELALLAAWAQAGAPECQGSGSNGLPDGGAGNSVGYVDGPVSLSMHVKPLLETYCGTCHSGGAAQGDFNVMGNLYSQLMAESDEDSSYPRVEPGNPQRSLIWIAMSGGGDELVDAMPFNTPGLAVTAPEDFKVIELWIQQGAPNN
ncbi:MAG: hypothetical protein WBV82_06165 [Myxococcaceae bacterium]